MDFPHIDTEGYDYKILSQLDLIKYNPICILFEYKHLQDSEKDKVVEFLKEKYFIFIFDGDALCILKNKISKIDYLILKGRLINL